MITRTHINANAFKGRNVQEAVTQKNAHLFNGKKNNWVKTQNTTNSPISNINT